MTNIQGALTRRVFNNSGTTINAGKFVRLSGNSVVLADNTNTTVHSCADADELLALGNFIITEKQSIDFLF